MLATVVSLISLQSFSQYLKPGIRPGPSVGQDNPYAPPPQIIPNNPYQPPIMPPPPAPYPNQPAYGLQGFANEEQQAIMWQQQYQRAPSGSWEESNARTNRDRAIQNALSALSVPGVFAGMITTQIESFADQMNLKYQQAPSSSALEGMYRQAMQIAYREFNTALLRDVQNLQYDWRNLHNLALQLDQKYQQAPSGSQKESAYRQAMTTAWNQFPQAVLFEAQRSSDFRYHESLGVYFDQLYQTAPSGSKKETTYQQVETQVFDLGVNSFRSQAYTFPQPMLYQIQAEYDQKYKSARSGSRLERFYIQIRDIARSLIH